jgi:hypothetical protein
MLGVAAPEWARLTIWIWGCSASFKGINKGHLKEPSGRGGRSEIHCVFEREADAGKLCKALQASIMGRYPGWQSQYEFGLGAADIEAIEQDIREVPS